MTNEELIAALEAADGPSRELDAEVAAAFGIFPIQDEEWNTYWMPPKGLFSSLIWRKKIRGAGYECPRYTSSIDAALMLKPEGCSVDLSIDDDNFSEVALITAHGPICATGATPALAICIAALKAGGEG